MLRRCEKSHSLDICVWVTILYGSFNGLYMVDEFDNEESSEFLTQEMEKCGVLD